MQKLDTIGFDISKSYQTQKNGRQVYVVGAKDANDQSDHFIIDKGRLIFLKLVRYSDKGNFEAEFRNYEKLGGGWIAPTVNAKQNGKMILEEKYYDIESPSELPHNIFDLEKFNEAEW